MILFKDILTSLLPGLKNTKEWSDNLQVLNSFYDINNKNRISHFLAQAIHESSQFTHLIENLNYSSERLLVIFPKYFKDLKKAKDYERNPQKIANFVYSNRMGNGSELSGDGWKFRGRGIFQITGRFNYLELSENIDESIIHNPDILTTIKYATLSAGFFWRKRGLNAIADENKDSINRITKIINGGLNGIEERKNWLEKIQNIIYNVKGD